MIFWFLVSLKQKVEQTVRFSIRYATAFAAFLVAGATVLGCSESPEVQSGREVMADAGWGRNDAEPDLESDTHWYVVVENCRYIEAYMRPDGIYFGSDYEFEPKYESYQQGKWERQQLVVEQTVTRPLQGPVTRSEVEHNLADFGLEGCATDDPPTSPFSES